MLTSIREYLQSHDTASLTEIARHIDADPDAVRGMLDHWVRKGNVELVPIACGGCTDCDPATIEIYRWQAQLRGVVSRVRSQGDG